MGCCYGCFKNVSDFFSSLKYKSSPASTIIVSERKILELVGIIGNGKRVTCLFVIFFLNLMGIAVPQFNFILFKRKNINELFECLTPFLSAMYTILKYLTLFIMRHKLVEVIDDLQMFWNQRTL